MFSILKDSLNIVEVVEDLTSETYKLAGDYTYIPESDTCPMCGHKNCFRIKHEGINRDSFAKCFSCSSDGVLDVTALTAKLQNTTNSEAAKFLAKKYRVKLPNDYSHTQELFTLASDYYHRLLLDSQSLVGELNGLTPVEYQEQIRRHTPATLKRFRVGWSDGGLIPHLESLGIEKEVLASSGLLAKNGRSDFLPSGVFIYPHYVRGRVSHFTFKDPSKRLEYQLPSKFRLNNHLLYNSDSVTLDGPVLVVEGENDLLSIYDAGWTAGVLCTNGSISGAQVDWIIQNLSTKDLVTIFDVDAAGDKYREKFEKVRHKFKSLIQVTLDGGVKDIDEFLKKGGNLIAALENAKVKTEEAEFNRQKESEAEEEATESKTKGKILVRKNAYYKIKWSDGEEKHEKISNFTISLLNIYIRGMEREREIVVTREDGKKSEPFIIPSEAKVSLKPFKVLVANAVDATFYGSEADMSLIWEYVYTTSKEKEVYLPESIGRLEDFTGWIFKDTFLADSGGKYEPDDEGVMWISNQTVGVKPIPIRTSGSNSVSSSRSSKSPSAHLSGGVPSIITGLSREDKEELLGGFIRNLGRNFGNMGDALTIMGWMWASTYSNVIFRKMNFFPYLYVWGVTQRGKSTVLKWLLSLYGMEEFGYTAVNQLNSGVSFSRKLAYYSSLPMCIDEIRADAETSAWMGTFRSWYDRAGRAVGTKEGTGIKEDPVRATLMFAGEDKFNDPGARSRCIPIRIPEHGRELVETYHWIETRKYDLKAIGELWISTASDLSIAAIRKDIDDFEAVMRKADIPSRPARNWACAAIFANRLCQKYVPDFNYMEYLFKSAKEDAEEQIEDDTLTNFWEVIEGIQTMEHSPILPDHISRRGDELLVWFAEVFRAFQKEGPYSSRDRFTKRAVLESIREKQYFKREDRIVMGMRGVQRRIIVLDIPKCPDVLQSITNYLG
jgi:5S rRNA maturation endonuclease (ribonuclease M5)